MWLLGIIDNYHEFLTDQMDFHSFSLFVPVDPASCS
jgi:hypothetical protein